MQDREIQTLEWRAGGNVVDDTVRAIAAVHRRAVEAIIAALHSGRRTLVECDKRISGLVRSVLVNDLVPTHTARDVTVNAVPHVRSALVTSLREELVGALGDANRVVVVRHLDLMCVNGTGNPSEHLGDVLFHLSEYADSTVLAFWDPAWPVPKLLEDAFQERFSLEVLPREQLWEIVSPEAAEQLSRPRLGETPTTFPVSAQLELYQYLSRVDVGEAVRILSALGGEPAMDGSAAMEWVRNQARTSAGDLLLKSDRPAGYAKVGARLDEELLKPVRMRLRVADSGRLAQLEALIPRGVVFHGPPGNGKTEWARWIATELQYAFIPVHGPELKRSFVGETEAGIRRLFARARRLAPAMILIDELDALMPSRDGGPGYDTSMVAQFLTEMDGLRRDEAVLVAGTTNRLDDLDEAFLRPGRFGLVLEVGFPNADDRLAILKHYARAYQLPLTGPQLMRLTEMTARTREPQLEEERRRHRDAVCRHRYGETFREQAGPDFERRVNREFGLGNPARFSGDHLRAACLNLLRQRVLDDGAGEEIADEDIDRAVSALCNVRTDQDDEPTRTHVAPVTGDIDEL